MQRTFLAGSSSDKQNYDCHSQTKTYKSVSTQKTSYTNLQNMSKSFAIETNDIKKRELCCPCVHGCGALLSPHSLIFHDERASRQSRSSPYLEIENLSETFNIHTRFDMLFERTGDQVVEIIQVTKLTLASRIQTKPLAPFPSAYLTSGSTSLGGFYTTCQ